MTTNPHIKTDTVGGNIGTQATKRGVNLGCGTICLPCERPDHHQGIPAELYTDPAIAWDNVDRNGEAGVSHVVDLFQYPWNLESNAYDYAIAAHLVEHIPHHIIWNGDDWGEFTLKGLAPYTQSVIKRFGQMIPNHPQYQDGWFAWFGELHRILKPGGKAYILAPFAWSHGGISDPTHTRYLTLASFGYFDNVDDPDPSFRYRMDQRWNVAMDRVSWSSHALAHAEAESELRMYEVRTGLPTTQDQIMARIFQMSHRSINAIVDFTIMMEAVKDVATSEVQLRPADIGAANVAAAQRTS